MFRVRRFTAKLLIFTLLCTSLPLTAFASARPAAKEVTVEDGSFVPGELIVCLKGDAESLQGAGAFDGLDAELSFETLAVMEGGTEEGLQGSSGEEGEKTLCLVRAENAETKEELEDLIETLEALPNVSYAQPNYVYALPEVKADAVYDPEEDFTDKQWAYATSSVWNNVVHMNAQDTYAAENSLTPLVNWNEYESDNTTPASILHPETNDMVVAVVDSGIDYTHEDLKNVMWKDGLSYPQLTALGGGMYGINVAEKNGCGFAYDSRDPYDDSGHGTHCAGIIGAQWNGAGVSGLVNGVRLMAVKIFPDEGGGSTADIIRGFNYIVTAQKAGVNVVAVNNSWGCYSLTGRAERDMIEEIGRLGAVSCFAAGNEDRDNDHDSIQHNTLLDSACVISVAAQTYTGGLTNFTCYGRNTVHVAAPGYRIYSTISSVSGSYNVFSPKATASEAIDGSRAAEHFESVSIGEDGFLVGAYFPMQALAGEAQIDNVSMEGYGKSLRFSHQAQEDKETLSVTIDLDRFGSENRPIALCFGVSLTDVRTNGATCYPLSEVCWYDDSDTLIDKKLTYFDSGWNPITARIPNTASGTVKAVITVCVDDSNDLRDYEVTGRIDELMLVKDVSCYTYMSGTSMATPAVTGEVVALMAANYNTPYDPSDTLKNRHRVAETIARVTGSVEPMPKEWQRELLISGGFARVDYALHGVTSPVLQSLSITQTAEGRLATLKGFYFNGVVSTAMAGDGIPGAGGITAFTVDGTDLTSSILETDENGTFIRFLLPESLSDGWHEFSISAGGKTGRLKLLVDSGKDLLKRHAVTEEMTWRIPTQILALQNRLYVIGINEGEVFGSGISNRKYMYSTAILNAGSAEQSLSEDWIQDLDLGELEKVGGACVCDRKILYLYEPEEGILQIRSYTPGSGVKTEASFADLHPYTENCRLAYTDGHLLLLVVREDENDKYTSALYDLDPVGFTIRDSLETGTFLGLDKCLTPDGEGGIWALGGYTTGESYYTDAIKVTFDPELRVETVKKDLFEGTNVLAEGLHMMVGTSVKQGLLVAGPHGIDEDRNKIADLYLFDSEAENFEVYDELISYQALSDICMTAYKGRVYIAALDAGTPDLFMLASTAIPTLKAEGDRKIPRTEYEEDEPDLVLPSYADTKGSWERSVNADGSVSYGFVKADGTKAKKQWVAVACSTWNKKDFKPWEYRWFYFDEKGVMLTGWFTDTDGNVYYLDPTPGINLGSMAAGYRTIDGALYYFKDYTGGPYGALSKKFD